MKRRASRYESISIIAPLGPIILVSYHRFARLAVSTNVKFATSATEL